MKINKTIKDSIKKIKYYNEDLYKKDYRRLVKALKEHRLIAVVESVSRSSMTRNIKFVSVDRNKNEKHFRISNFVTFFKAQGHTISKNSAAVKVYGFGIDMVFKTLYDALEEEDRNLANNYEML